MALPKLSDEQRAEALNKARISRQRRAEVKNQLKSGELSLREVFDLANDEDVIAKTKVKDILTSIPRIGKVKAEEIMDQIGIMENRRLRGLGSYQSAQLTSLLDH